MDEFDIEKSVGFLVAKVYQRLFACFRDGLAPYSLTPQQFALLAFLWRQDNLSQVELSEKTEIDRTTLSGLVDRLAKMGLVERRSHPADRRAWRVHLTAAGGALEEQLVPIALQVRERFTKRLDAEEYAQLCALLKKLRDTQDD